MALSIDRETLVEEGFEAVMIKPVLPMVLLADIRDRIGPADE
jgi:hypothetical protein